MSALRGPLTVRVFKTDGTPASGASVQIKTRAGFPGTATFWATRTSPSPLSGTTFTTDSTGRVSVWALRGLYAAAVSGTGVYERDVLVEVTPSDDGSFDSKWYSWGVTHENYLPSTGAPGEVARVRITHPYESNLYSQMPMPIIPTPVEPGVVWEYFYDPDDGGGWNFVSGAPLVMYIPGGNLPWGGTIGDPVISARSNLITDIPLPTAGTYKATFGAGAYRKNIWTLVSQPSSGTFTLMSPAQPDWLTDPCVLAVAQRRGGAGSTEIMTQSINGCSTITVTQSTTASLVYDSYNTPYQTDAGTDNRGLLMIEPAARIYT